MTRQRERRPHDQHHHLPQGTIWLKDARRVTAAAEERANEIGQPQNIAVVNTGGDLILHIHMDGAWIGSIDIAINKAYTARRSISTADSPPSPARGAVLRHPEIQPGPRDDLRRRVPLKRDGQVVGAVGVSGGDGKQDTAVAEAAAAAF